MISNQILQNTIDGIRDISHMDLCVMDPEGRVAAATADIFEDAAGAVKDFVNSPADSQSAGPFQYFKVIDDGELEYIVVVHGEDVDTLLVGRMAAFQVQGLAAAFQEHYDRDSFMKNLLLDNLLLIDIYERAKKLHIQAASPRVVLLIDSGQEGAKDRDTLSVMQEYIGTASGDFVTAVDEKDVVIVLDVSGNRDIDAAAQSILDYLKSRGERDVRVSYGTVVAELKEISKSYKEARMALDVARIFFEDREVIAYDRLGIGRLIYQLPIPLCRMFIREVFRDRKPEDLDEEMLTTIDKFFENNLNVSETSRQLFIHRNTLVYRLDKLQKSTGLDLRVFDDAITFKIAMMVVKYMKYMDHEK